MTIHLSKQDLKDFVDELFRDKDARVIVFMAKVVPKSVDIDEDGTERHRMGLTTACSFHNIDLQDLYHAVKVLMKRGEEYVAQHEA